MLELIASNSQTSFLVCYGLVNWRAMYNTPLNNKPLISAKFIIVQSLESKYIVKLSITGQISEIQKKTIESRTIQNVPFQSEMQSHLLAICRKHTTLNSKICCFISLIKKNKEQGITLRFQSSLHIINQCIFLLLVFHFHQCVAGVPHWNATPVYLQPYVELMGTVVLSSFTELRLKHDINAIIIKNTSISKFVCCISHIFSPRCD